MVVNDPLQIHADLSYGDWGGKREKPSDALSRLGLVLATNASYFSYDTNAPRCTDVIIKNGKIESDGETDGHVDDICNFIGPAEVVCCYTEDQDNEYYETFKSCYEVLSNSTDAKGRPLKVHKLIACRPFAITKDEAEHVTVSQGVGKNPDGKWRHEGDLAVPSYANFLVNNGSIIFPIYGLETDEEAIRNMEEIVGDRYVVRPVNAHEIALCGCSIHCFTQQVSK